MTILSRRGEKYKNIGTGDEWKVLSQLSLLKLLNENYSVPCFYISCKNNRSVDAYNMVPHFRVVYISMPF